MADRICEYQDQDVDVTSRSPLRGQLELMAFDDEPIYLMLDHETAELLMSALVQFLAQGEGEDALNLRPIQ
jgi:hypothetical protein